MASYRKRKRAKADVWVVQYKGSDGKWHLSTCPTEAAAKEERAKRQLQEGNAAPNPVVGFNVSVRDYAERWLSEAAPGLKRKTVKSYADTLTHHLLPRLGTMRVRDLHQQHIVSLLSEKLSCGKYKTSTVRLIYATIRRLLSRARFEGVIANNAAQGLWKELPVSVRAKRKSRRRSKDEVKALAEPQLEALLASAVADREHYALFFTMARTGLRIGEALGLQLQDVDIASRELTVRRNLSAAESGLTLEERLDTPKSGSERTVDLSTELAVALGHHLAHRRAENLRRGLDDERSPWLFPTSAGTPKDESRVRKAFKAAVKRARLPLRFTPHSLRHSYATLMLTRNALNLPRFGGHLRRGEDASRSPHEEACATEVCVGVQGGGGAAGAGRREDDRRGIA